MADHWRSLQVRLRLLLLLMPPPARQGEFCTAHR
jgi:hypothetical protein